LNYQFLVIQPPNSCHSGR